MTAVCRWCPKQKTLDAENRKHSNTMPKRKNTRTRCSPVNHGNAPVLSVGNKEWFEQRPGSKGLHWLLQVGCPPFLLLQNWVWLLASWILCNQFTGRFFSFGLTCFTTRMVTCRAWALRAESSSISHMHGSLRGGCESLHGNALSVWWRLRVGELAPCDCGPHEFLFHLFGLLLVLNHPLFHPPQVQWRTEVKSRASPKPRASPADANLSCDSMLVSGLACAQAHAHTPTRAKLK